MSLKLVSELEISYAVRSLELIRNNTKLLDGWTRRDIIKLASHLKFISFYKSNIIAKRNEYADYFAILITGKVLLSIESQIYGYFDAGDVFGYMKCLNVSGNQSFYFDMIADGPGYMAIIRGDDLKKLMKSDSNLMMKLWELMGKKALDIVNFQFKGSNINDRVVLEPTIMNFKKTLEILELCLPLSRFLSTLEKRDKKYIIMYSQIIEIEPKKLLAREMTRCSYLLLILKGKTITFHQNGDSQIDAMGTFLGREEFLVDSFWKYNVFGNETGYIMKIDKHSLYDMASACPTTAQKFYSFLLNQELLLMKKEGQKDVNDLHNVSMSRSVNRFLNFNDNVLDAKTEERLKLLDEELEEEFIEIDIKKKIQLFHSDKIKKNYESYGIPPLHAHEIFALKQQENREFRKAAREAAEVGIKVRRKKNLNEGMSTFLKEKLLQQYKEKMRKRAEKRNKVSAPQPIKKEGLEGQEELEEDLEEIKNEMNLVNGENEDLRLKNIKITDENKRLREELKNLTQKNILMQTEINKYHLLKELLSKGINTEEDDMLGFRSKNYRGKPINMEDVVKSTLESDLPA